MDAIADRKLCKWYGEKDGGTECHALPAQIFMVGFSDNMLGNKTPIFAVRFPPCLKVCSLFKTGEHHAN
jgi:hypothetical protein